MDADRWYRIPETVIHQTLDGEAVVINLDNGRYYALNHSASRVWNAIADGHSLESITDALAPTENDRAAIVEFVGELHAEALIAPVSGAQAASAPISRAEPSTAPSEAPRMETYTDMERLLPLDPLHEVDERGWPNRKRGE